MQTMNDPCRGNHDGDHDGADLDPALTPEQMRVLTIVADTPSSEVRLWTKENVVANELVALGLVKRTRAPDWVKLTNAGLSAVRPPRGY
jgi:hypothetical protein